MPTRVLDRQTAVRLPADLAAAMEEHARESERTVAQVIRIALRQYLESQGWRDLKAPAA